MPGSSTSASSSPIGLSAIASGTRTRCGIGRTGALSRFALSPEEVVARSQPRSPAVARAAAHFELGEHLWNAVRRDGAIGHFREAHRLQPDNWTYKRQAWSLISVETQPGPRARLRQWPTEAQAEAWPFDSDFERDLEKLPRGDYYPDTMAGE